jgi:hypothetical protein
MEKQNKTHSTRQWNHEKGAKAAADMDVKAGEDFPH